MKSKKTSEQTVEVPSATERWPARHVAVETAGPVGVGSACGHPCTPLPTGGSTVPALGPEVAALLWL